MQRSAVHHTPYAYTGSVHRMQAAFKSGYNSDLCRVRSSMDRMRVSEALDTGSIPVGRAIAFILARLARPPCVYLVYLSINTGTFVWRRMAVVVLPTTHYRILECP